MLRKFLFSVILVYCWMIYSTANAAIYTVSMQFSNGTTQSKTFMSRNDADNYLLSISDVGPYLKSSARYRIDNVDYIEYRISSAPPVISYVYLHTGGWGIPLKNSLEEVVRIIDNSMVRWYGGSVQECSLEFVPLFNGNPGEGIYNYNLIMIGVKKSAMYGTSCDRPTSTQIGKSVRYSCPSGFQYYNSRNICEYSGTVSSVAMKISQITSLKELGGNSECSDLIMVSDE